MGKHFLIVAFTLVIQFDQVAGQSEFSQQKITVSFEKITLKELLDFLEYAHNFKFSYSSDNTPLSKEISIHAYEMDLDLFLDMMCFETGLSYNIIEDQIVLRQDNTDIELSNNVSRNLKGSKQSSRSSLSEKLETSDLFQEKPLSTLVEKVNPLPPDNVEDHPAYQNLKFPTDRLSIILKPSTRQPFNFRQKKMAGFGIGVVTSYVHLSPTFRERPNKTQQFYQGTNFSYGLLGVISPGGIFSGTMGILYTTKNYFLEYNYQLGDSGDPVGIPDQTKLYLSYLALPMNLNYRFFKAGRFSLYLSGGLSSEILIREEENTIYLNKNKEETAFFTGGNSRLLIGGAVGMMLWYDLRKSLHVFLKSESVYYLTSMNKDLMRKPPRLLKVSAGLSMRLRQ